MKNPKNTLEHQKKIERRAKKAYALAVAAIHYTVHGRDHRPRLRSR